MARAPRPTRATLTRLVRVRGKARKYRDPQTGIIYSDRQVRTARAEASLLPLSGGFLSREEIALERKVWDSLVRPTSKKGRKHEPARITPAYVRDQLRRSNVNNFRFLVATYQAAEQSRTGKRPRFSAIFDKRTSVGKRFWNALVDLRTGKRKHKDGRPVGPKSKVAQALVILGLRDPGENALLGQYTQGRTVSQAVQQTRQRSR